jgi:hypothetical protein
VSYRAGIRQFYFLLFIRWCGWVAACRAS